MNPPSLFNLALYHVIVNKQQTELQNFKIYIDEKYYLIYNGIHKYQFDDWYCCKRYLHFHKCHVTSNNIKQLNLNGCELEIIYDN